MSAIFKREFNAYFSSPIGYVFIAMFYCLSGFFFFLDNLAVGSAELRYVYSMLFTCSALLMPILTMRMLSEDMRQKTDQVLLTAPIGLFSLLMGKFLAALLVYVIAISITLVMRWFCLFLFLSTGLLLSAAISASCFWALR